MTENNRKGFRVPRKTAVLNFEGGEFAGAEVKCAFDVSLETYLMYQALANSPDTDSLRKIFQSFGKDILLEWNLEDDDGGLIPADGDSLMDLPATFSTALVNRWLEALANPPVPLDEPSPDGDTSEEAQTETAT